MEEPVTAPIHVLRVFSVVFFDGLDFIFIIVSAGGNERGRNTEKGAEKAPHPV